MRQSEALMQQVETRTLLDLTSECDRSGNVLTIEADSGEQIVINRHTPTQQMWLCHAKGRTAL